MKCVRCNEKGGRTRDHIFPKRLLSKYGRNNRIFGTVNIQRMCRPCHDIKEAFWLEHTILIDYRSEDEREELKDLAGRFRLPVQLLREGKAAEQVGRNDEGGSDRETL